MGSLNFRNFFINRDRIDRIVDTTKRDLGGDETRRIISSHILILTLRRSLRLLNTGICGFA